MSQRQFCTAGRSNTNQNNKHVTKRRLTVLKTSTPKHNVIENITLSLSDINSIPSSSGSKKRKLSQTPEANHEESLKKKKRERIQKTEWTHLVAHSSKFNSITTQDDEWETQEQETVNESDANMQESTPSKRNSIAGSIKLFESPYNIEAIRESAVHESLCESPIIGSNRRLRFRKSHLRKNIDELLPINLSLVEKRDRLEEMDEDETFVLHRENNVKTYPSQREVKRKHQATWRELVENLHGSTSDCEFLKASPQRNPLTVREALKLLESSSKESETVKTPQRSETPEDPIPPGMVRIRGHCARITRKWTRTIECGSKRNESNERQTRTRKRKLRRHLIKELEGKNDSQNDDIYNKFDETDNEFETSGHNKKMTFSQFRNRK